ncbi:MAG: transporter substrate-binding protein [Dactylosporangium sp.]|jgi:NitT/TauT family transport system substrate-binding protein|nr:transporter substrate-binding protein [Dactylosporangium sp.]
MSKTIARRRFAAALALVGLVLAGCGGHGNQTQAGSGGQLRVSVGVDPAYAPIFLADKEGLFHKHGIDVQVVQTAGGPAPAQDVIAGTSQLGGNADSTALSVMSTNPGLRAIGLYEESGRYLKVVLRQGISDPHQIKTMGTIPGLGLYSTVKYLESEGVAPDSVKLVQAGAPEMPSLLGKGTIDGYVLYEPWAGDGLKNGGKAVKTIGDFGVNYHMWLVADEKWLSSHSDQASRFVAALAEADQIVGGDPQRACTATEKSIKMPVQQCLGIVTQIDFKARGFTDDDLKSSKDIVDFFMGQKIIKSAPDLGRVILKDWYQKNVAKAGS